MSAYINGPQQNPQLLQKGVPAYLLGSFSQQTGVTNLGMATDAIAANVATVTATYLNGPLPVAGSLITIFNSTNSTDAFNINRVALTSVAYVASTNIMTLVFPLTASNQTATADSGSIIIEPAEVGEAVTGNYTSQACCVQAPEGDSQFTVPVAVTFPTLPTAATVNFQVAIRNVNSEYTTIGTPVAVVAASAQTVGPVQQITLQRGYFYRFIITGVTGTASIVGKVG